MHIKTAHEELFLAYYIINYESSAPRGTAFVCILMINDLMIYYPDLQLRQNSTIHFLF